MGWGMWVHADNVTKEAGGGMADLIDVPYGNTTVLKEFIIALSLV